MASMDELAFLMELIGIIKVFVVRDIECKIDCGIQSFLNWEGNPVNWCKLNEDVNEPNVAQMISMETLLDSFHKPIANGGPIHSTKHR